VGKILLKLFFFLLPVGILLYGFEYLVTKGLTKTGYSLYGEWNEVNDGGIDADLVVMGSSRAVVHVSPKIIDSLLDLNSYNLGLNGFNFFLHKNRLDFYLEKNNAPKYIIHCLDVHTLEKKEELFQDIQFLPYLNNATIRKMTQQYEGLTLSDYNVPFFRYRKHHDLIRVGLEEFFETKHYTSNKKKGHYTYYQTWVDEPYEAFKKKYPINIESDSIVYQLFDSYLLEAKKSGIKVFLVYPPYYHEAQKITVNRASILNQYQDLAKKHEIPFWDYSNDSLSLDKKFFMDYNHLNKGGMELFSKRLSEQIEDLIKT